MEDIKKKLKIFNLLRYLGLPLGALMTYLTQPAFGDVISVILGVVAGVGFYLLCGHTKNGIISDTIADSLRQAMEGMGQEECIFEIKMAKPGMIIRIYLIKAGELAPKCSKALIDAISTSWYKNKVWITQIVDISGEEEFKEAQLALNEELLADLKKDRKKK